MERATVKVQEALVTLAKVAGMLEAFSNHADVLGETMATDCAAMAKELDEAREVLRVAAGAA